MYLAVTIWINPNLHTYAKDLYIQTKNLVDWAQQKLQVSVFRFLCTNNTYLAHLVWRKQNLESAVQIDDQQRRPACSGRSYVDRPAGRDVRQAGGVRSSSQTSTHMHTSKSGIMGDQIKGGSMLV
jgi:hypothetical protein